MKHLPVFLNAIFCEQVREEVRGSVTFVGVKRSTSTYSKPPPFAVNELTIVAWIVTEADFPSTQIEFWLDIAGKKNKLLDTIQTPEPMMIPQIDDWNRRTGTVILRLGRVLVPEEGYITLLANINDIMEPIARLKIRQRPSANEVTEKVVKKPARAGKRASASTASKKTSG